jgi:hypothetical protein
LSGISGDLGLLDWGLKASLLRLWYCTREPCELRLELTSREPRGLRLQLGGPETGHLRAIASRLRRESTLLWRLLLLARGKLLRVWRLLHQRLSRACAVGAAQEGVG